MKAKEGFLMRKVGERAVVVPVGKAAKQFHGMINLNETGGFLWSLLMEETNEERMLEAMLETYDIGREQAKESLERFLEKLREAGILEE